ncbi:MAG: hypothetical protein L0Z50_20030 [Verrucomicrobiales bacterium]|nr:hypothetical protein [Verrucomicrobiales bacterium]
MMTTIQNMVGVLTYRVQIIIIRQAFSFIPPLDVGQEMPCFPIPALDVLAGIEPALVKFGAGHAASGCSRTCISQRDATIVGGSSLWLTGSPGSSFLVNQLAHLVRENTWSMVAQVDRFCENLSTTLNSLRCKELRSKDCQNSPNSVSTTRTHGPVPETVVANILTKAGDRAKSLSPLMQATTMNELSAEHGPLAPAD